MKTIEVNQISGVGGMNPISLEYVVSEGGTTIHYGTIYCHSGVQASAHMEDGPVRAATITLGAYKLEVDTLSFDTFKYNGNTLDIADWTRQIIQGCASPI